LRLPYQLLWESIGDVDGSSLAIHTCFSINANHEIGPYIENPIEWVNINAFQASLFATGIWGASKGTSVTMMRWVFEKAKKNEVWEQEADIMAAAQWIIWFGHNLFKLILYDDVSLDDDDAWRMGDGITDTSMQPRSVERWRFWKAGFDAVAANENTGSDCKKLAARAAGLMGSIEQAMCP
jgi:hypothetical protein